MQRMIAGKNGVTISAAEVITRFIGLPKLNP
jgi:hypothetical protein